MGEDWALIVVAIINAIGVVAVALLGRAVRKVAHNTNSMAEAMGEAMLARGLAEGEATGRAAEREENDE